MTKIPTFALALLFGVPTATAALAGTATDNERNIYQSESVTDATQPTSEQQVLKVRDILAAEGHGDGSDIATGRRLHRDRGEGQRGDGGLC